MNCVYMLNFKQSAHSLRQNTANTLHNINRVKLFTKISSMAGLRDILRGWGPGDPPQINSSETFCIILAYSPRNDISVSIPRPNFGL